jgi:hypothetical protein
MIKTLDFEIEHEDILNKTSPVSLESLFDEHNKPSIVSVHYSKKEFGKGKDKDGMPRYYLKDEQTIVYIFDCKKKRLNRAADYKGNFREKGFAWGETLLKEYFAGDVKETEKISPIQKDIERNAYILIKKIIHQLKEDYQNIKTTKERTNYNFFIRILKKVNVSPYQKNKQLSLIN